MCLFVICSIIDDPQLTSHSFLLQPRIFGRYGFVNMEGSGRRAALVTPFHRIQDGEDNHVDESMLVSYLSYDDGYEECIPPPTSTNFDPQNNILHRFKQIKLDLLKLLANRSSKWVVSLPPSKYRTKIYSAWNAC